MDSILDYGRAIGRAVIGGYAYRGPITQLRGHYFFGDFHGPNNGDSRVWSIDPDAQQLIDRSADLDLGAGRSIEFLSSFGEDAAGNLYRVDLADGEVFIVVADLIRGDTDASNFVDENDIPGFIAALAGTGTPDQVARSDTNGDGVLNALDIPVTIEFLLDGGTGPETLAVLVDLPEPATLALAILGGLTLLRIRPRWSARL